MTSQPPPISVVMPVYNGAQYIGQCIGSLLGQSFPDFELIIVNDASTDDTVKVVESFSDPRIRLVHNERNLKISATINHGLELARGKYIALANHDDIFHQNRLEKEYAFLERNPGLSGVGSWYKEIDAAGNFLRLVKTPSEPEAIAIRTIIENSMANSSVMLSAGVFRKIGAYDPEILSGLEDWDLYSRMIIAGLKIYNMKVPLMVYRNYPESYSRSTGLARREKEQNELTWRNLKGMAGLEFTLEQTALLVNARYHPNMLTAETLAEALEISEVFIKRLESMASAPVKRKELKRTETFLSLHLASAAMTHGRREVARKLLARMIKKGEKPVGALGRLVATCLGEKVYRMLRH